MRVTPLETHLHVIPGAVLKLPVLASPYSLSLIQCYLLAAESQFLGGPSETLGSTRVLMDDVNGRRSRLHLDPRQPLLSLLIGRD